MSKKLALIWILILVCVCTTSCDWLRGPLSGKADIFQAVQDNMELLKKLPDELRSQNLQANYISTTEKIPLSKKYKDIEGLYCYTYTEEGKDEYVGIKNDLLAEVLDIEGINAVRSYLSGEERPYYIFFECGGSGFGSATSYYGFYYIEEDIPYSQCGYEEEFVQKDNGWYYREPGRDDTYYTERITKNWFYYEEHY